MDPENLKLTGGFFDDAAFDLSGRLWAILPSTLTLLSRAMRNRVGAVHPAASGFQARDRAGRPRRTTSPTVAPAGPPALSAGSRGDYVQYAGRGTVGVLSLMGVIMPRDCLLTMMTGGVGLESFVAALRDLADSPAVKSICIVADSPGGSVFGCMEAAAEVRMAAAKKKVVVAVSSLCERPTGSRAGRRK